MMNLSMRYVSTLGLAALLAACSGEDGSPGPQGPQGGPGVAATVKPESCRGCHEGAGANHQAAYDSYTDASTLVATIDSVESVASTAAGKWNLTVNFTLAKDGSALDVTAADLVQKTIYATRYDPATRTFGPTVSLGGVTPLGGGQYRATTTNSSFDYAEAGTANQVFAYFAQDERVIADKGSYKFYDNLANVSDTSGTVDYASAANVEGCENCHGSPYQKHGYRVARVAGLPDFAACKACHWDGRDGGHQAWQLLADDPAAYAAQGGTPTADQKTRFAYKATVMNDTHMSHAMEFAYPQTMANCVACHEGKLTAFSGRPGILDQEFFTIATCKSCHPVVGVGGTSSKRAPALQAVVPNNGAHNELFDADPYNFGSTGSTGANCVGCHNTSAGNPTFAQIHTGYNDVIYDPATGQKYADTITTIVDSATFAGTTLTVDFQVDGAATDADVRPFIAISLYGYDSKDFIVSSHGRNVDDARNLEATFGAAAHPRIQITKGTGAAFTMTADLSAWISSVGATGSIKRAEVGILPQLGRNQAAAPHATNNPFLAISGKTVTVDLVGKRMVPDGQVVGKAIVDPAKCNKCHAALGTTFHNPTYGMAGTVACRLCHVVGNAGGHLEMQSRSIDSYVHAIHAMQPFDVGDINFTDPVAELGYEHHVGSTYPNFTLLNCNSCHNDGTFEVPDQSKSLPSLHSPSAANDTWERNIEGVPGFVTGPASRACGSCHRSQLINGDAAGGLDAFNEHTNYFGYLVEAGTGVWDAVLETVHSLFP
jgi:OmcA/MtrC family decaheme c-type cytochrome